MRGHFDHLTGFDYRRYPRNRDLRLSINEQDQRIEGRGVFTQPWPASNAKAVTDPAGFLMTARLTTDPV
jgi:hypothetical protein